MTEDGFQTGSLFWTLFLGMSLTGLIWLGLWSFHNESVQGAVIVLIFSLMIISGILFSKFQIFNAGSWTSSSISFSLGFLIYTTIGSFASPQNVLFSVQSSTLLATVTQELPRFIRFIQEVIIVPIAEESLWLIAIPFLLISSMNRISDLLDDADNPILSLIGTLSGIVWFQIVMLMIVAGLSFGYFHLGKLFTAFLIGAFIFRGVITVLTYGDEASDLIPGIDIVPAFGVGAHIGNNWTSNYGFFEGVKILFSEPIGILIGVIFGIIFLTAINWMALKIFEGSTA